MSSAKNDARWLYWMGWLDGWMVGRLDSWTVGRLYGWRGLVEEPVRCLVVRCLVIFPRYACPWSVLTI
ncbi:hypothetical protein B0O80DRAFT_474642 [Mortierella sp. GBAus27b]|nr:hypothetical protein B0O80DRAFT_474642 [Mortierella sp. GBAus27b]